MSKHPNSGDDFESRLLAQLKAVVGERGAAAERRAAEDASTTTPAWRRRGPRLALGGAIALTGVAIALIVSAGGDNASKAFAVEPQDGGGVTITIYSLSDAAGLERALRKAGIQAQVTWLPAGMVCREPHYTPSVVHLPGGGSIGDGMTMAGPEPITFAVGSTRQSRERFGEYMRGDISQGEYRDSAANVNLDPEAFRPDQSVVLSGTPTPYDGDPEGGSIAKVGVAEGPVEPCDPVPALPSGSGGGPFGLTSDGGVGYVPRGEALPATAVGADLRRTATAAKASDSQVEAPPGPGQFLYTKTKVVQLQGWLPEDAAATSETRPAGPKAHPRYFTADMAGWPDVRNALVATLKEVWTSPDGTTRVREVLDRVRFLSAEDQGIWEEAGSPPPFTFDPEEHDVRRDSSGDLVKDFASKSFRGRHEFSYAAKLSQLPTEPEALRLAIENRHGESSPIDPSPADSQRGGGTVESLLEILGEPITSPELRAAVFNALAEIPGIGFERGVVDAAGRQGDAISWVRERGFGQRFIFDPQTAELLAAGEMIFGPPATDEYGAPAGTAYRETAHLQSGIVDSTDQTPGEKKPEAGGQE